MFCASGFGWVALFLGYPQPLSPCPFFIEEDISKPIAASNSQDKI
jgi:hypothetical protein